jgi:hypothetical protein
MPSEEEIADQQKLLETHRRTLATYLVRRAKLGEAHIPPEIEHGIADARNEIRRIKGILRVWDVTVEDLPNDEGGRNQIAQDDSKSQRSALQNIIIVFIALGILLIVTIAVLSSRGNGVLVPPITVPPVIIAASSTPSVTQLATASDAISTTTNAFEYNGTWKGGTTQGGRVYFVVKEGKVTNLTIEYPVYSVSGKTDCPISGEIFGGEAVIESNLFTYVTRFVSDLFEVKGEFRSSKLVIGTFRPLEEQPSIWGEKGCGVFPTDWEAKKQ